MTQGEKHSELAIGNIGVRQVECYRFFCYAGISDVGHYAFGEGTGAFQVIQSFVPGSDMEPSRGVSRHTFIRPRLEGTEKGLAGDVFRNCDVFQPHHAAEYSHNTAVLCSEQMRNQLIPGHGVIAWSPWTPSPRATRRTSTVLPSPCSTGLPLANSTASSTDSARTMIYPPIVSLISPKGPLVTILS